MLQRGLLLAFIFSVNVVAETDQWQLWKQQEGASIYFKEHLNGILQVRAEITINDVQANDFMALLSDTEVAPLWIENVTQVDVLKNLSPSETIVWTQFNSPWPVSDRDMISYSCYQRLNNAQTKLTILAVPDYQAKREGVIRITELKASWLFTENSEGAVSRLTINHQVYADPGGTIPHWLSNKVALSSAMRTMQRLKTRLINKEYKQRDPVSQVGECTHQPSTS